jgi:hypothetical protein
VKTLNKVKLNGACFGLCLAACLFWSRGARAEVTLIEQDGWTFSFDGRVNAFLSGESGNDFPNPTPDPNAADPTQPSHTVMGGNSGNGIGDVGWRSSFQNDANNKFRSARIRSGMYPNILGFGLARRLSETTTIKAYVSLWSTVETLGRDKWAPVIAEAREGYFTATGTTWGSLRVGRMMGWMGRTSYEIDSLYGHGYGLGLPCTDGLGPACGHIGTGVLFPGYSAGVSYSTPEAGGMQLHLGIYDPLTFTASPGQNWGRAAFVRPEGSITFARDLGPWARIKIGVEGLFQPLERVRVATDMTTTPATTTLHNETTSIWGVSGGARVEAGPLRLGASAFRGRGVGLGYAGQRSSATADDDVSSSAVPGQPTFALRTFTGYYGQIAFVSGPFHVAAGYGQGLVDQLPIDKINPHLSVLHSQTGISGALYYHISDSVVFGIDYFRYVASWYGAPIVDPNTGAATGGKLRGEKQTIDFLNVGATYHW